VGIINVVSVDGGGFVDGNPCLQS